MEEETRLIHAGGGSQDLVRTVGPPIQKGSTVLLPCAAALYDDDNYLTYGRGGLAAHEALKDALAEMEGAAGGDVEGGYVAPDGGGTAAGEDGVAGFGDHQKGLGPVGGSVAVFDAPAGKPGVATELREDGVGGRRLRRIGRDGDAAVDAAGGGEGQKRKPRRWFHGRGWPGRNRWPANTPAL